MMAMQGLCALLRLTKHNTCLESYRKPRAVFVIRVGVCVCVLRAYSRVTWHIHREVNHKFSVNNYVSGANVL